MDEPHKTSDAILASAMEKLAESIVSEDGVANAAIREAGQRITELSAIESSLRTLMPFVLEDFYPGCSTKAYREAVENVCHLLGIKAEAEQP
jgi:hypothetical protein